MKLSQKQYFTFVLAVAATLGYVVDHAAELGLNAHWTAAIAVAVVFFKAYLNPPASSTPEE